MSRTRVQTLHLLDNLQGGNGQVVYYANLVSKCAQLSQGIVGNVDTFDLPEPAVLGTARLYRNGQRLVLGVHFTQPSTTTVHLLGGPAGVDDVLDVEYGVTGENSVQKSSDLSWQANGQVVTFVLPEAAIPGSMRVYRNGQRLLAGTSFVELNTAAFTLSGPPPSASDFVEVEYRVSPT